MQARLKINDCRKSEIPLYETPGTFSCARAIHSIWNIYLHKDFINIYKGTPPIRKIDFFRALPKLPLPPPPPNSGKLYHFFWTSKTKFSAYYKTK